MPTPAARLYHFPNYLRSSANYSTRTGLSKEQNEKSQAKGWDSNIIGKNHFFEIFINARRTHFMTLQGSLNPFERMSYKLYFPERYSSTSLRMWHQFAFGRNHLPEHLFVSLCQRWVTCSLQPPRIKITLTV